MLILRILRFPPRPQLRIRKHGHNHDRICHALVTHSFTSAARLWAKPLPPRRKIDENELEEKFIRGCGPGGQKIVSSSLPCPVFFYLFKLFTLTPGLPSLSASYVTHITYLSIPFSPPSPPLPLSPLPLPFNPKNQHIRPHP